MSNICLKVTLRKIDVPKLQFYKFLKFVPWSVFEELRLTQVSLNFKTLCYDLKTRVFGSKTVCGFSIIFILKGILTF